MKYIISIFILTFALLYANAAPPNIIVIITDDMGFSDIGCFGGEIKTPNIDGLARNGLRFTQFYNAGRCCPTRASLLTGLYPHQTGVGHMIDRDYSLPGYSGYLNYNCVTIAQVLKPAGYSTYAVGKWHVTPSKKPDGNWPLQRGFDRYYGIVNGGSLGKYFETTITRDNDTIDCRLDKVYRPANFYMTDAFGDNAVMFLQDHIKTNVNKPFFMYLAFTASHFPLQAKKTDMNRYVGVYDGGYSPIRNRRYTQQMATGIVNCGLSKQSVRWPPSHPLWEVACMRAYAAQTDCMDQNVGKVVNFLRSTGTLDNTLIFYLHDNGGCAEIIGTPGTGTPGDRSCWNSYGEGWANVSNTPFRLYKRSVHEGGIATPLVVHWPSRISRSGQIESQPGHLIDIMATCVDVSGARYPSVFNKRVIRYMEGRSLSAAFQGLPINREFLLWEHEGNRALRIGDWKIVAKGSRGAWELYNMKNDRCEMHNKINDPACKDVRQKMIKQWDQYARIKNILPWPW